jgi:hypothetical protein
VDKWYNIYDNYLREMLVLNKEISSRVFPVFMKRHIQCPTSEAQAEEIEVYRICKMGCIEQAFFCLAT